MRTRTSAALDGFPPPSYSEVEHRPSVYIINISAQPDEILPPSYEDAVTIKS